MIKIRKSAESDGQAVYDLLWSARAEIPLRDTFENSDNRAWIMKHCGQGHIWIALDGKIPIGFLFRSLDELFYLVVASAHRGNGVGRALLRKGKRKGAYCRINPTNAAAISLVETEGFVKSKHWAAGQWVRYDYRPS
jgi:GNAT superfamily N-acetyltransferase